MKAALKPKNADQGVQLSRLVREVCDQTPREYRELNLTVSGKPNELGIWATWANNNGFLDLLNLLFKLQIPRK